MTNLLLTFRVLRPFSTLILYVLTAIVIGGCSQHKYPDDWSEKKPSSTIDCPDISGIYYDTAIATSGKDDLCKKEIIGENLWIEPGCKLNAQLGSPYNWSNKARACPIRKIEIKQTDKYTIDTVEYLLDEVVHKHSLHMENGDFSCQKGTVILRPEDSSRIVGYYMGMASASGTRVLFPSEDGSLVMKIAVKKGGVVFIVPFYSDTEVWYRWARTDSTRKLNDECQSLATSDSSVNGNVKMTHPCN